MKLLIITPIFPPEIGGPASYVWNLAQRLKKNHKITIICFTTTKVKNIPGVKIISISAKSSSLFRQLKLARHLFHKVKQANVVYIQGALVVGFFASLTSKIMQRKCLLKFVGDEVWETARVERATDKDLIGFHKSPKTIKYNFLNILQKFSLTLATTIIVPSEYLKDYLINTQRVNRLKIKIIANAVEVKAREAKKLNNHLIFVGRLVPWKNVDLIIRSVKLARLKNPWKLSIIGEGPEKKKLIKLTKKLKGETWVNFQGNLSINKTQEQIARARKLILISDYEGLSHTLIESMLAKTAVIASDIKANREVLDGFGQFVVLNKNTVENLAIAINNQDYDLSKAQKYAQKKYGWQKHIGNLEKIL